MVVVVVVMLGRGVAAAAGGVAAAAALLEADVLVAATATRAKTRVWRRRRDIFWSGGASKWDGAARGQGQDGLCVQC